MKGLTIIFFFIMSLSANAMFSGKTEQVLSLKTHTGISLQKLTADESAKILKSLELNENIEIREEVIYPEEVSEVLVRKLDRLTKGKIIAKRPNPRDYN